MNPAGLLWRTIAVSAHDVEKQRANLSIRISYLVRRGRSRLPTPATVGSGTRRVCVQAVNTSSRPQGIGKQPFVEPQWLFPSNYNHGDTGTSAGDKAEESSTSGRLWSSSQGEDRKQSDTLYYIVISTAKNDRSGLSEPNAGLLLSLIGENGKAIMQKIAGTEYSSYLNRGKEAIQRPPVLFQRGAVDVMTIVGPDLGRLAARWIAPAAGTWRLEKVSVTILPRPENLVTNDRLSRQGASSLLISDQPRELATSAGEWKGIFHLFESDEALLGDDAWLTAAELKPSFTQETSDLVNLQEKVLKLSPELAGSTQGVARLQEESMKEYENLKLSLLGFSSLLVVAGTVFLAALGQGELAEGFASGGAGGFCYLLLLQRAVDQLPGPQLGDFSKAERGTGTQIVKHNKDGEAETLASSLEQGRSTKNEERFSLQSPVSGNIGLRSGRVALVAGVALLLGRLAAGGAENTIAAPELLAGVAGFFMSKVAVVLAARKPTSSPGDN